jgi:protease I
MEETVPRALMITGDAAEDLDAMYPLYRLREAGWDVDVAALTRRPVQLVVHDFDEGYDAYSEKPGRRLPVDFTFAEVEAERYGALVIPGGRAPEYIRNDPDCARIVKHFMDEQKPLAHLCHGALTLTAAGLLEGRRSAAYPALAPDVRAAGAEFVDSEAVVDGLMVSGRAWPDHPAWMREFIQILRAKAPATP